MNDLEILIPEFDKNPKGVLWYLIALIAGIILGFIAFVTKNYTFGVIIVLFGAIIIIRGIRTPRLISLIIDDRGISLGNKFWEYKDIKNFSVFVSGDRSYFIFTPIGKYQLSIKVPVKSTGEIESKLINSLTQVEYQEPFIDGLVRILKI